MTKISPLIDPTIPDQDIRFAVVQGDIASLEQTTSEYGKDLRSARDHSQLARDANSGPDQPLSIVEGGDVVLYASCEVHQQPDKLFEGTVFPHGIFFAHEPEKPASFEAFGKDNKVGVTAPLYWTRSRSRIEQGKQWSR